MGKQLNSFKDLIVWQRAIDLAASVYNMTDIFPSSELYGLSSQMRRSVISISSNIAEGFKRIHKKEKLQLYNVAYASTAELESQLEVARRLNFISPVVYNELFTHITEVSKMMNSFIRSANSLNPKSQILNSKEGFTLIEIIITVSITILLSGYIILYGGTSRNQTAVYVEEAKISQMILRAKAITVTYLASTTPSSDESPCGYGFEIDYSNQTYRIFAYEKSGNACNPLSDNAGKLHKNRKLSIGEEERVGAGVRLVVNADSIEDVLFRPPAPTTDIFFDDPSNNSSTEGNIYVQSIDGGLTLPINVNKGGQVNL